MKTTTPTRAAQAALDSLASLANDPAGSRYTLAEIFGTRRHAPQIEGVRALEALAMLDAAALDALAADSPDRPAASYAAAMSRIAHAAALERYNYSVTHTETPEQAAARRASENYDARERLAKQREQATFATRYAETPARDYSAEGAKLRRLAKTDRAPRLI